MQGQTHHESSLRHSCARWSFGEGGWSNINHCHTIYIQSPHYHHLYSTVRPCAAKLFIRLRGGRTHAWFLPLPSFLSDCNAKEQLGGERVIHSPRTSQEDPEVSFGAATREKAGGTQGPHAQPGTSLYTHSSTSVVNREM